jgi:phosphate starvation-inducible PhoH-like protein
VVDSVRDIGYATRILAKTFIVIWRAFFWYRVHLRQKASLPRKASPAHYNDAMRTRYGAAVGPAGPARPNWLWQLPFLIFWKRKYSASFDPSRRRGANGWISAWRSGGKVNPYLRPLYDALYDMVDMEKAARSSTGVIEVAPQAFMRGRTPMNPSSSDEARIPLRADENVFDGLGFIPRRWYRRHYTKRSAE